MFLPSAHCLWALQVDGRNPGLTQVVSGTRRVSMIEGFVKQGDTDGVTLNLFKFAAAEADGSRQATSSNFQEGRIHATVQEVVKGELRDDVYQYRSSSAARGKVAQLPEGKKVGGRVIACMHSAVGHRLTLALPLARSSSWRRRSPRLSPV